MSGADEAPHNLDADGAWHFRVEPEDGGRDYGSANVWTLPADLKTLVRETGQNSLDHAVRRGEKVHMRYSLIELTPGSAAHEDFFEAVQFEELRAHLEEAAATKSKLSTRLRGGLRRLDESEGKIRLLRIDDFGATGLFGQEKTTRRNENNPFASLVRNNLDSSKRSPTAGGSFGLGKAVLWRCSSLSTVLFASDIASSERLEEHPAGVRFAGKSELTWHQLGDARLAGPGWLGRAGTRGESIWVSNSDLEQLQLSRASEDYPPGVEPSRSSGTSVLILGFQDPSAENPVEPKKLLETIAREAAENFWPVMIDDGLHVSTRYVRDGEVREETAQVDPLDYVFELCDAVLSHESSEIAEELENPGDVVRLSVPHRIPATEDETGELQKFPNELEANAHLLVRLAKPEEMDSDQLNKVAFVRGRGMVVRYWPRRNLVVGARPFHAVLLAGRAAGSDSPHIAAEQFLRLAEPPAHNDWEHTEEVKEKYERGSGVRLDDIRKGTTSQLTKVLKPQPSGEDEGPKELKRLLQLATHGPSESPTATLRRVKQTITDGKWEIRGEIHLNDRSSRWGVTPRLRIDAESGEKLRIPWESLEIVETGRGEAVRAEDDVFRIEPDTRKVKFTALSAPEVDGVRVAECRTKLDLRVKEIGDAEEGD